MAALECGRHIVARECRRYRVWRRPALSRDQIAALSRSRIRARCPRRCARHRAPSWPARSARPRRSPRSRSAPRGARPAWRARRPESTEPDLAAQFRAECDAGVQHARQLHVHAKFSAAVHLARRIEARQGLADQAKFGRVLERHLLGDRQSARPPRPARRSSRILALRHSTIRPLLARQLDGSTRQRRAAAVISIERACAPALRSFSQASGTLLLVPVI